MPAKRGQAIADLLAKRDDFDHDEFGYRPMELALTIENMLAQSAAEPGDDAPLAEMVDPQRIGAGGHSMGGYTVLARIGCLPAATDQRIKVAVIQSPASWMWEAEDYQSVAVPTTYMIGQWETASQNDRAKFIDVELAYTNTPAPTWQIEIARAGHLIFADPRTLDTAHLGEIMAGKIMADRIARADTIVSYTTATFDRTLKADDADAVAAADATLAEGGDWVSRFQAKPTDPPERATDDDQ